MKPFEFMRVYHPKLGVFVDKHVGSGIIVDNIFKPAKSVLSSVVKKFVKPMGKKAIESGISHAGERLGKKTAEKSGEIIMKKLKNMRKGDVGQIAKIVPTIKHQKESTDMIIDRLISGSGLNRMRYSKNYII